MALGFKEAGYRTVLANEWDKDACDTLRASITDRVLNCAIQEIESFPAADVVVGGLRIRKSANSPAMAN